MFFLDHKFNFSPSSMKLLNLGRHLVFPSHRLIFVIVHIYTYHRPLNGFGGQKLYLHTFSTFLRGECLFTCTKSWTSFIR